MIPGIKGMKTLVATPSRVKHYRTKSKNNREFKILLNEVTIGVHIVNLSVIHFGRLHHEKFANVPHRLSWRHPQEITML